MTKTNGGDKCDTYPSGNCANLPQYRARHKASTAGGQSRAWRSLELGWARKTVERTAGVIGRRLEPVHTILLRCIAFGLDEGLR